MNPEQTAKFDSIRAFQTDLLHFKNALEEHEARAREAKKHYTEAPPMPRAIEELRQKLLPQVGAMKPLCDRLQGRMLQPQPYRAGPDIDVWQLAMQETFGYWQSPYVGHVADAIAQMIGQVASDPSLLDPPATRRPVAEEIQLPVSQNITINATGTVNFANSASGEVTQTATVVQAGVTEMRRLLKELEDAISTLDAPQEEREALAMPVEQLRAEIAQNKPVASRLVMAWGGVKTLATIDGVWRGWDHVQQLLGQILPQVEPLIHALTGTPGI